MPIWPSADLGSSFASALNAAQRLVAGRLRVDRQETRRRVPGRARGRLRPALALLGDVAPADGGVDGGHGAAHRHEVLPGRPRGGRGLCGDGVERRCEDEERGPDVAHRGTSGPPSTTGPPARASAPARGETRCRVAGRIAPLAGVIPRAPWSGRSRSWAGRRCSRRWRGAAGCRRARAAARAPPSSPPPPTCARSSLRVEEARRLSEAGAGLPLGGVGDVESHLDRAAKGGVLEPLALRECAALVRAAARTRDAPRARAADLPRLWALAEPLSPSDALADRIERAIEPSRPGLRPREPRAGRGPRARPRAAPRPQGAGRHPARRPGDAAPPARQLLHDPQRALRAAGARQRARRGAGHRPQRLAVRPDALRRARLDGGARQRALDRQRDRARGGAADPPRADRGARARRERARARPRPCSGASTRSRRPRGWPPTSTRTPRRSRHAAAGFELLLAPPPAAGPAGEEGGGEPRPARGAGAGAHRLGPERRRQDGRDHRGRPLRADAPRRAAGRGGRAARACPSTWR